ncbi:hypothetical protein [Enterococcus alishanensis]
MQQRQDYLYDPLIPKSRARVAARKGKVKFGSTIALFTTLILGVFIPLCWLVSFIPLGILVKVDKSRGGKNHE